MILSPRGLALAEELEGCRLQIYYDSAGKRTIGIGHLVKFGEDFSAGITREQAIALLQADAAHAAAAVQAAVTVPLAPCQADALILLIFNVGPGEGGVKIGALVRQDGTPTNLLTAVNARNRITAARGFTDYDNFHDPAGQVHESPGLLRREMLMAALFLEQPFP